MCRAVVGASRFTSIYSQSPIVCVCVCVVQEFTGNLRSFLAFILRSQNKRLLVWVEFLNPVPLCTFRGFPSGLRSFALGPYFLELLKG